MNGKKITPRTVFVVAGDAQDACGCFHEGDYHDEFEHALAEYKLEGSANGWGILKIEVTDVTDSEKEKS